MNPSQFPTLGKITTPFGASTEQEAVHPGVDIANAKGTPIKAAAGGKVIAAIKGIADGANNFGNSIVIQDQQGNKHRYSHLNSVNVKPGQQVGDGQNIATMGASGAAYAPNGGDASNLDYRVVNAFGQFVNPAPYIDKL